MLTPPSPTISPTLTTQDLPSRKRQRSESMQSDPSSSSPKRSASLDPFQDPTLSQSMPTTTSNDDGIDAYMEEQEGEPNGAPLNPTSKHGQIDPETKLEIIDKLLKTPMDQGQTWYLVASQWYKRWHKVCTGEVDKEGEVTEDDLGPVDNSPLVDLNGILVQTAMEHADVEFVPEEAWHLFVKWYGTPKFPLSRQVITRGLAQTPALEVYPPRLRGHVLTSSPSDEAREPAYFIVSETLSLKSLYQTILQNACGEEPPLSATGTRIWKLAEGSNWDKLHYPATQLQKDGATLIDSESIRSVVEALIETGDAFVVERQVDGHWIADMNTIPPTRSGITTPQATPGETPKLFGSGADFFSRLQSKTSPPSTSVVKATASSSGALKPPLAIKAGPSSFTRSKAPKLEPGTLGLGNMGNTCFMNSAIQCLAHTKELTDYFLTGVFEDELNPDNPLGMQGAIAEAFGALLRRIWDPQSNSSSYSPREFKQVLQKFAPQFGGYQQHDSQELVAFLLDGLHEDLNRVLKKPYVEKPDWEGGGDKELVALANKSWEGYMKRNDSVIVDLFQGQYQSTLVCPECSKVSITFDPFMYLTLPLPIQKKCTHTIYYIPWDLSKPHVKVPMELSKDASFRDVRQQIARWMGTDADHLLTLEIYGHRFYKNLDDYTLWGDMGDTDIIVCFELPCNSQQSRVHKRQNGDAFIIPIFLCDPVRASRSTYASSTLFGYPFFVVVTEEQARDEDALYDAVVERLQRWTANARDLFRWEFGPAPTTLDGPDAQGLWQRDSSHSSMEEVKIPLHGPSVQSITEIKENGDVVTVEEPIPEEGDIVDEKSLVIQDDDDQLMDIPSDAPPHKVGYKKDIFHLCLHPGHAKFGVGYGMYGSGPRHDNWDKRRAGALEGEQPILLQDFDAFYCEFDENMKAYYFGDIGNRYEQARWDYWEDFIHPEFRDAQDAAAAKKNKNITIEDCLEEFTREEKLGEDDLWYCPSCKKHQQATKRFDLWKVPDILVVHLKRFSNSRTLRDKIDALVDFPLEGLDLTAKVGEYQVAKKLAAEGADVAGLGLCETDEPLVYDLYAVDEHLGGLGGGHYRAYAVNHPTGQWYHFDDGWVTTARPEQAVNSNAYLLFYKRRTSRPRGGPTHLKVEEARNKLQDIPSIEEPENEETQLPTPPSEAPKAIGSTKLTRFTREEGTSGWADGSGWGAVSNAVSPASTPPPLSEVEPDEVPSFHESQYDELLDTSLDPLQISATSFTYPDPTHRSSPTSSNEVEPDTEDNIITEDEQLDDSLDHEQDLAGPSERVVGTSKLRLIDGYRPPDVTSGGDSPVEWREVDIHNSVAP